MRTPVPQVAAPGPAVVPARALDFAPVPGDPGACAAVASLARHAHLAPGFVRGLPVADGARDTTADVEAAVAASARLWLARAGAVPVGAARVVATPGGAWRVERVSVHPAWRRGGVARGLLAAIESAAAADGVGSLELDAVVERRLATFYARLGFRVVTRWPSPDKPLTEATMRRPVGAPAVRYAGPGDGDDAVPADAVVLGWLARPGGDLVAVVHSGRPRRTAAALARAVVPGAGLVGLDLWPNAGAAGCRTLARRLADGGAHTPRRVGGATVLRLREPAPSLPGYRMPRRLHPSLLAWWRPLSDPGWESSHA